MLFARKFGNQQEKKNIEKEANCALYACMWCGLSRQRNNVCWRRLEIFGADDVWFLFIYYLILRKKKKERKNGSNL